MRVGFKDKKQKRKDGEIDLEMGGSGGFFFFT